MKRTYSIYKRNNRGGYYYLFNSKLNKHESLHTTDRKEAQKILDVRNQERQGTSLNLQLGKAYFKNANPEMAKRTWQHVINIVTSLGKESSQKRSARELGSSKFDIIRAKLIVETSEEDFKVVLQRGGAVTNLYLRRLHNLALEEGWLVGSIISSKRWIKPKKIPKRAITEAEHAKIIVAEHNLERRHYYEMLWLTGAAQTDGSRLTAENIDLRLPKQPVLSYRRCKTGEWCHLAIGIELNALLQKLPKHGFLFPQIARTSDKARSAEFYRRRKLVKIDGVSLHSYRYAWAERAHSEGYPERFAQAALGHKSKAIHHGYAKNATVICPPLGEAKCPALNASFPPLLVSTPQPQVQLGFSVTNAVETYFQSINIGEASSL